MSADSILKAARDPVARTIRAYDSIASSFAGAWFDDPVMEPQIERFLSLMDGPGEVLDAGCGPGRDVWSMARRRTEAVGIDLSRAMLSEARSRVPGSLFRQMDVRDIRYPTDTFKGVWSCASLHHLPFEDIRRALSELVRVLQPDGVLGATVEEGQGESFDHQGRFRKLYSRSEFQDLIVGAGLITVEESWSFSDKTMFGEKYPKRWYRVIARKPPQYELASEQDCPFCVPRRFQLERTVGLTGAGSVLWGDSSVYIAPDLAPLMEGHLLMISAQHRSCFGACMPELDTATRCHQSLITRLFLDVYRTPALFLEHGPARRGEAGSCIDHAHLHCLPLGMGPMVQILEQRFGPSRSATLKELRRLYDTGTSYLYVQQSMEEGRVYVADVAPSQFFRQAVASVASLSSWRWQTSFRKMETQHTHRRTLHNLWGAADHLLLTSEESPNAQGE